MTKEAILKRFKESGLFEKLSDAKFNKSIHSGGPCVYTAGKGLRYYELTADQCAVILGKMGLQAVWFWDRNCYGVIADGYDDPDIIFKDISKGELTFALNAGVAWTIDNRREELERSL